MHPSHWLMSPQTTYKGKSSFQTYSDYLRWEDFLQQQLKTLPEGSALHHGFQTCEHWKQIFMEIIGKQRAVAGDPDQGGYRTGLACLSHACLLNSGQEPWKN